MSSPANDYLTEEERKRHHNRIRRTKKLLRYIPRKTTLENYPFLRGFGKVVRAKPHLWSFKVTEASPAIYAGAIIACLPLYGIQFALALGAAFVFRVNLPILLGLQLITNPATLVPFYAFTHRLGRRFIEYTDWNIGVPYLHPRINALIVGGLLLGIVLGMALDVIYRILAWRLEKRKTRFPGKSSKKSPPPSIP